MAYQEQGGFLIGRVVRRAFFCTKVIFLGPGAPRPLGYPPAPGFLPAVPRALHPEAASPRPASPFPVLLSSLPWQP